MYLAKITFKLSIFMLILGGSAYPMEYKDYRSTVGKKIFQPLCSVLPHNESTQPIRKNLLEFNKMVGKIINKERWDEKDFKIKLKEVLEDLRKNDLNLYDDAALVRLAVEKFIEILSLQCDILTSSEICNQVSLLAPTIYEEEFKALNIPSTGVKCEKCPYSIMEWKSPYYKCKFCDYKQLQPLKPKTRTLSIGQDVFESPGEIMHIANLQNTSSSQVLSGV